MAGTTYPNILGLQSISATVLDSMLPLFEIKSGSTTRASTTTLADDPDLVLSLPAASTWEVEIWVQYAGLDTANIQTAWDAPSDATGLRQVLGPASNAVNTNADQISMRAGVHGFSTSVTYGCARNSTNQQGFFERGLVTMNSAGNIALQWAQATSNATATQVDGGSIIRAWRLA